MSHGHVDEKENYDAQISTSLVFIFPAKNYNHVLYWVQSLHLFQTIQPFDKVLISKSLQRSESWSNSSTSLRTSHKEHESVRNSSKRFFLSFSEKNRNMKNLGVASINLSVITKRPANDLVWYHSSAVEVFLKTKTPLAVAPYRCWRVSYRIKLFCTQTCQVFLSHLSSPSTTNRCSWHLHPRSNQ